MLGRFYKDDKGLRCYENFIYSTMVYISENSDGLWQVDTFAPIGNVGIFETFGEAFDMAERECLDIEREASERRSRYSSVASDNSEF